MPQSYANLIDGEMVTTARSLDVINPATEEVIGQVPACGKEELDRAVAAARRAFASWRKTPVGERRRVIAAMADVIAANHDELYRLLTAEQGKPHHQAQGEMHGAPAIMKAQATLELADVINQDDATRLSRTRRVPVGVV
jgi:acyl-CoA reductase-like NAD-dependent aldehyde dehydrogenase